jgi:hypothetical protein
MEYTRLGNSGLRVSRLALGCMSYGDSTSANAPRWALDDDAAQPFFRQALERASPSGTRRTCTNTAPPRSWSVAPSSVTPVART